MVLTQTDCETLFTKLNYPNNVHLESFALEPFTKVTLGYLGSHLRLLLKASNGQTTTLFVKTVSPTSGMVKCFEDVPLFEKELFVYRYIKEVERDLPELNIDTSAVPKLLLTKTLTNGGQVMVFEDLQRKGYNPAKNIYISEEYIMAGLKTLAKFHTISLVSEIRGKKNIRKISENYGGNTLHVFFNNKDNTCSGYKYYKASQAGAIELLKIILPEKLGYSKKMMELSTWHLDILNDDNPWRKVLCQGDAWCYNMLFKHSESGVIDAKLVDFQLCRYAPPAHDVTMWIFMASDHNVRRKNILKFYNCYYDALGEELRKHGVDIDKVLPRNEYDQTCKIYIVMAKFTWLMYRQSSEQNEENTKFMMTHIDYMLNAIVGIGRCEFVKRLLKIDDGYRIGITRILKEYIEALEFTPVSIEEVHIEIGKKLMKMYGQIYNFEILDYNCKEVVANGQNVKNDVYKLCIVVKVYIGEESEIMTMNLLAKMVKNSKLNPDHLMKMALFEFEEVQN